MPVFLFHGSFSWLLAGIIVAVGAFIFVVKAKFGRPEDTMMSIGFWIFIFWLHKGDATAGVMTATVAALLADLIFIPLLRLISHLKRT